jgi:hypothetical protein
MRAICTLSSGSACSRNHPTTACPASWYATVLRSWGCRTRDLRSMPPITRSIACSKCFVRTSSAASRAAMSAASLHTFAMSAPENPGVTRKMDANKKSELLAIRGRAHLAIRGRTWQSGSHLAIRGRTWQSGVALGNQGRTWQSGVALGNQGSHLAIRGRTWQSGVALGNQGSHLAIRVVLGNQGRTWQSGSWHVASQCKECCARIVEPRHR